MNIKNLLLAMANDSWITSANTSYTTSWSTRYLTNLYTSYSVSRNTQSYTTAYTNISKSWITKWAIGKFTWIAGGFPTYYVYTCDRDSQGNWIVDSSKPQGEWNAWTSRITSTSKNSSYQRLTSYVTRYYSYKSLGSRYTSHITSAVTSRLTKWETE
ncbi:hypothetical protein [Campylobacter fetus]|uniref:hypothetical protein n=1 Tax=Campylobacter fetus TaxID=196 RepID=UPI00055720A3|nr:hypothetical protein [Campylobacter fetus]WKW24047.1 hypothetical protein IXZ12_05735 [Campylobacter fetus subsp. venerealis]WKW24769.1 hypothetical protein IXZ12_09675 [Campylobacter fetus subsp. venerealis]